MSISLQRHREGETNSIPMLATASTGINIGDILGVVSNNCVPCTSLTAGANTAASKQAYLKGNFAGISLDQRLANNTTAGNILVGQSGVYELLCKDEDVMPVGTLYGAGNDLAGNHPSMTLESVATANLAIARLARLKGANATTAWFEVIGPIFGGTQEVVA